MIFWMLVLGVALAVEQETSSFVAYTIPGCGHCRNLAPAWARLQERVAAAALPVSVSVVDCAGGERDACSGIQSFPTIKWNGVAYHGPKDAPSLELFVRRSTGPAVRHGPRALWEHADVNGTVVFGSGLGCDARVRDDFAGVASALRQRMFFVWTESDHAAECRIEAVRQSVAETERWDAQRGPLSVWAARQPYPVLAPFDKWLHGASRASVAYLFHDGPVDAHVEALSAFRNASLAMRYHSGERTLLFAHVDVAQWDGLRTGITKPYPRVAVVDHAKLNHHYPFAGAWSELAGWLRRYADGLVERTLVGESDLSTDQLVSASFERHVTQRADHKDVLVMFGSAHCGSSVAFRPIWDTAVQLLRDSYTTDGLSIMTADGWANDWPDWVNIVGLPDVRVFPADNRRASARYSGPRNASALVAWIRDKAYVCL